MRPRLGLVAGELADLDQAGELAAVLGLVAGKLLTHETAPAFQVSSPAKPENRAGFSPP